MQFQKLRDPSHWQSRSLFQRWKIHAHEWPSNKDVLRSEPPNHSNRKSPLQGIDNIWGVLVDESARVLRVLRTWQGNMKRTLYRSSRVQVIIKRHQWSVLAVAPVVVLKTKTGRVPVQKSDGFGHGVEIGRDDFFVQTSVARHRVFACTRRRQGKKERRRERENERTREREKN